MRAVSWPSVVSSRSPSDATSSRPTCEKHSASARPDESSSSMTVGSSGLVGSRRFAVSTPRGLLRATIRVVLPPGAGRLARPPGVQIKRRRLDIKSGDQVITDSRNMRPPTGRQVAYPAEPTTRIDSTCYNPTKGHAKSNRRLNRNPTSATNAAKASAARPNTHCFA